MNKRFLVLSILFSALTSISFVGIFLYFTYSSQVRSITEISSNIHSSYLQEIIYNYKNDLVSGNYRSFRNQIASMIDRKIFSSYLVRQGDEVLDSLEDFESKAVSKEYSRIIVPIWFDEGKTSLWGQVELLVNVDSSTALLNVFTSKLGLFIFLILSLAVTLVAFYTYIWQKLNIGLTEKVNNIFEGKSEGRITLASLLWEPMLKQLSKVKETNDRLAQTEQANKIKLLMISVTEQVAHDIRSPLSALNVIINKLPEVPEVKLKLLKSVAQRINDIADDLLVHGKKAPTASHNLSAPPIFEHESTSISDLISAIVIEKKIQYAHLNNLTIEADYEEVNGSSIKGKPSDWFRILSNIINNSIEAFEDGAGQISVRATITSEYAMVVIHDNGKGIPEDILFQLGKSPISYGKENSSSGNGLGLFHAAQTIRELGGKFDIRSKENTGTMIEIKIPFANVHT